MTELTLTREQLRDVDRRAVEVYNMPSVLLMENAGRRTAELLLERGEKGPIEICCGKGNNGGDGYVIARHLENAGCQVRVLLFCSPREIRGDAAINLRILLAAGTPLEVFEKDFSPSELTEKLHEAEWIVDSLLGTGTQGEIRPPYSVVIQQINESPAKKLAVDLPSGMDCDTGEPLGPTVQADLTASFVARKVGFDHPDAVNLTGEIHVLGIGVPRCALSQES